MNDMTDFYEDDEPVEKIVAAFEAGEKFITGRQSTLPANGVFAMKAETYVASTPAAAFARSIEIDASAGVLALSQ